MPRYVAFLRGMNLGRRRIQNPELCACFEDLGFNAVSAFLASGNVIFETGARSTSKLEATIEKGLKERLEYDVPTFVRSVAEVHASASHAPFLAAQLAATTGNVQVALLSTTPSASAFKSAAKVCPADDKITLHGRELYWLPKGNMSDSELDIGALGKLLGPMTIRAQRTMVRLAAKLG